MTTRSEQSSRTVTQSVVWGAHRQQRLSAADTMFANTGRRMYVIGDIDGRFRPRSNPYDLHAFGHPQPDDPLAGKLQGVWAQPVKGFDGYSFALEVLGERWELSDAVRFTQTYAAVEFEYERLAPEIPVQAARRDFAALNLPVLFTTLTVRNTGSQALDIKVLFTARFDLEDAWFTSLAEHRNVGETVTVEADRLVARSEALPERWAAAAGCAQQAELVTTSPDSAGLITCAISLAPGAHESLTFAMVVESEGGAPAALQLLEQALANYDMLLAEKQALYDQLYRQGPRLVSPDCSLNAAFDLAQANMQVLEAEQSALGRYFYAGLEMFPFWFSCDGAYSLPGMMAAGLRDSALNHLRIGLRYLEDGRVPHQISPSGKMAFAGNAQEPPLWVMSIWDAYRWTGDTAFLCSMFQSAWAAVFDYVLGTIDSDGDGYPSGPGMVEVEDMGAEKLDSAAYTWAALNALSEMAGALGKAGEAEQARQKAEWLAARFDADWWDEPGGSYAISLDDPGNARKPVPHWAVIVPLEVGLASENHAARTFSTLRAQYLNRWGLKHTVGSDERVWTLPTATLSRAAFRYQQPELGLEMLRRIADTLAHGPIGSFHELIPEGACFVQLWSGAAFLRGIIEDLLGIEIRADLHQISLSPRCPQDWDAVRLENLAFGAHLVRLRFSAQALTVDHLSGPTALLVRVKDHLWSVEAGDSLTIQS